MTYYLPINSASLAHYFVCACIKPARYFDNKPKDVQDKIRNVLILSSVLGSKDTDCCIEIVLTKDEENSLTPCGKEFLLFPFPLPISRVKTIFFRERRQLEQTLSNINMSAAFIPNSLAKVANFSNVEFNVDLAKDESFNNDYSNSLQLYDRILGALALMKIAKEPYMNYSENYASTLSFFNALIKDDLIKQGHQINEKFFGLFSRTGNFLKFLPYLEKKITKEDLEQIAVENNQIIDRSFTKAINFDKLSGITYAFAILQSYGVGGEAAIKKIDALISTNFEELKVGKAEGIALYYGYNRGYSVFNNSYGTEESGRQIVKYLLNSKLDYYTIESVYQFSFYSKTTLTRFSYLDEWCPNINQHAKRKNDYIVLDTAFIGKKKPSVFSKDYLQGFLAEFKTFDFLNVPLTSLVELIRKRVADDTKEELEDVAETKISEAQAMINSLKRDISSQQSIISNLQRQNDKLTEELKSLKSKIGQYPIGADERAFILNEPSTMYGSDSADTELNDFPGENQPIFQTSKTVSGYSSGKKDKKEIKERTRTSKQKSSPKNLKKSTNKALGADSNKGILEPFNQVKAAQTQSFRNGDNPTLFEENE